MQAVFFFFFHLKKKKFKNEKEKRLEPGEPFVGRAKDSRIHWTAESIKPVCQRKESHRRLITEYREDTLIKTRLCAPENLAAQFTDVRGEMKRNASPQLIFSEWSEKVKEPLEVFTHITYN